MFLVRLGEPVTAKQFLERGVLMQIRNHRADRSRKFRVGRKPMKAIERHRTAAGLIGPDLANRQLLARRQTVENLLGHLRRPQEFT